MAVLPFGMWDVGNSFYEAVDLEDEEDDQYEEESVEKRTQFKIECADPESLIGDVLVIAIGTAATTFLDIFIDLPTENIGNVVHLNQEGNSQSHKQPNQSCMLYKMDKKIICQCKSYVNAEDTHQLVKQIIHHIKPKYVSILSSQPKSSFQGDMHIKNSGSDVLRHLKTSHFDRNVSCPMLEHGNLVSDLPAAVLSYCQIFNLPAVLYVNFAESHFVDVFSVKTYQQVLNDYILDGLPKVSQSKVTQKLKNFDGVGVADNNLYI